MQTSMGRNKIYDVTNLSTSAVTSRGYIVHPDRLRSERRVIIDIPRTRNTINIYKLKNIAVILK
ncbi:hypothetical protein DPMN_088189 [Dreissena polymorpha]|uniref:Uncharacterized protein n=1 Tax=Dreissena polymorpha TaxID=45954 RepID=A0A9D4KUL6_DREPO|nr:hypothetical protein DPMN_088189 [Dreissena polymorpha]